ncbi:NADP-dependent oxidoreductase domain-containing protein [Trametes maxima]|nr:NADP-dependent oxidoreductase domain-containing protein [Trametes maxima]
MNKETSCAMLNAFYDAGGKFVHTANHYQNESSEGFIGERVQARGVREHMIITTKHSSHYKRGRTDIKQHSVYVGNNLQSLRVSLDESLKKLRTDYVAILYWNYTYNIEEVMDGLHDIVAAGEAFYLVHLPFPPLRPLHSLSLRTQGHLRHVRMDRIKRANRYARDHSKTPFVIFQGEWNVLKRDFERDVIPMARDEGMALAPWYVFAGRCLMYGVARAICVYLTGNATTRSARSRRRWKRAPQRVSKPLLYAPWNYDREILIFSTFNTLRFK